MSNGEAMMHSIVIFDTLLFFTLLLFDTFLETYIERKEFFTKHGKKIPIEKYLAETAKLTAKYKLLFPEASAGLKWILMTWQKCHVRD